MIENHMVRDEIRSIKTYRIVKREIITTILQVDAFDRDQAMDMFEKGEGYLSDNLVESVEVILDFDSLEER